MQSSQNLLVKGISCTVTAKDKLRQCSKSDESHRTLQEANAQLSSAIALLRNAFLELSYERRDLMTSGIDSRFHALCSPAFLLPTICSATRYKSQSKRSVSFRGSLNLFNTITPMTVLV
eukprot:scpid96470/ scgid14010/ 